MRWHKTVIDWGISKTIGKAIIGAGIDALKGYLGSKQGNDDYYLKNSGISTYNTNSNMTGDIQGVPLGALTPPNTKVDVNFKPFVPKKVNVNPPAYNFNPYDNTADMSDINAKAQKQTQINQQQAKPPDEKVINIASQNYNQFLNAHYQNNYTDSYQNWQNKTQQEIHAEMARYAAHPKYNDYVNEYYAKDTGFVPNSAIAGLQSLRRSVEAGAYARKMIDINRAEALQYFQDKYVVNLPADNMRQSVKDVYDQSKNIAESRVNQFRQPKYDLNKDIVDRNKAAKLAIPDATKAFNQYLSGKSPFSTFNLPESANGKYLYNGKIVSPQFFNGVKFGIQLKQYGIPLNEYLKDSSFTRYTDDAIKAGYRLAEGKNPWQAGDLKYIDAYDKSAIKLPNGDYVVSTGQIVKSEELQSTLWMEGSMKKEFMNTDKARDKLINDPNSDITVAQAGIKVNPTITKMVKEG